MSGGMMETGVMQIWAFDTMVSMTLLMALVLLIRKPVSHFFGAHIAYLLWALPLARLFMPTLTVTKPATEAVLPVAPIMTVSDFAASAPAQQVAASAFSSLDWMFIGLVIWAGGAGLLFVSKLAGYCQFRADILADGQTVGKHGKIKILETAAVGGPLAFGIFDKYIAVPTNFFRDYTPKERELALEHEITHHESGDLAANFIGLMILSLHWFNPVAWFAWIAFRQDQETACDARILQKSGRGVRAIYGRTIAKSMSGHRLGLASPLNQKDKIKGRLKMLGQSEKSPIRKRLGALIVGAGAVIALPLTATVTYAVETEAHSQKHDGVQVKSAGTTVDVGDKGVLVTEKVDGGYKYTVNNKRGTYEFKSPQKLKRSEIDQKLSGMIPSYKKMSTQKPASNSEWVEGAKGDVVNITMLNGSKNFKNDKQYVHRIKHDGRTIILRTNKKLSAAEVRELVPEAEESRLEADGFAREAEQDIKEARQDIWEAEQEVKEAQRETAQYRREAQWEASQAVKEAAEAAREAQWKARQAATEAQNEARNIRRQTSRIWTIANQVSEISFAPRPPRTPTPPRPPAPPRAPNVLSNADCAAMNKQIAMADTGSRSSNLAFAVVAGCKNVEVKIDRAAILEVTLKGLEKARSEEAKCKDKSQGHKEKLKSLDRSIQDVKSQMSMT